MVPCIRCYKKSISNYCEISIGREGKDNNIALQQTIRDLNWHRQESATAKDQGPISISFFKSIFQIV